jgi:hypothetical protein
MMYEMRYTVSSITSARKLQSNMAHNENGMALSMDEMMVGYEERGPGL